MNTEAPTVTLEQHQQLAPPPKAAPPVLAIHGADWAKHFAKAQANFTTIRRTLEVFVKLQGGGGYTFSYAPLDEILSAVMPALNAEGFSLTQRIGRGESGDYIETTLLHETGERKNQVPIFVTGGGAQQYASGVTYARRYGITLLLCVAAEQDDDGNAAQGNQAKVTTKGEAQVVMDPGENRHTAPMKPAFELPKTAGPPKPKWMEGRPGPLNLGITLEEVVDPEGEALVKAEGRIADAIQDFHEAALEGRRVGIEQIWAEIKTDAFVATQTWRRLKDQHPDSFATVQEVLKPPKAKGEPRGKKP